MNKSELLKDMTDSKFTIIDAVEVGHKYRLAIYKGTKTESIFDFVVRYRENFNTGWSRIRTPKHVHWIVDILIKRSHDREETLLFVREFEKLWNSIKPITIQGELDTLLSRLSI
ncbi:MAG: hypothetical protein LBE20_01465 [Deltaproteobacteria bacterium]|jgi:hypothetical protein|nr:hypothetical protein [Deltaproteobacteria bacterium]